MCAQTPAPTCCPALNAQLRLYRPLRPRGGGLFSEERSLLVSIFVESGIGLFLLIGGVVGKLTLTPVKPLLCKPLKMCQLEL